MSDVLDAASAAKLTEKSLEPSSALMEHIFKAIRPETMKGKRYTTFSLSEFKLSSEQVQALMSNLRKLGYIVTPYNGYFKVSW